MVGIAHANIDVKIKVTDSTGTDITVASGNTVYQGTTAYINGTYIDDTGNLQANAIMGVAYSSDGVTYGSWATIWSGTVNDGDTITKTHVLSLAGYYKFNWTCDNEGAGGDDYGIVRTKVKVVIPEPGTIAGLAVGIVALGAVSVRKSRKK
jgi:hypothetical protein